MKCYFMFSSLDLSIDKKTKTKKQKKTKHPNQNRLFESKPLASHKQLL